MPLTSADIKLYLSGGAANNDPNASLGGAISSTEIVDNTLHNLFDKVTGAEAETGDTEYRAFFVKNTHATLTYEGAKIYIHTNTVSGMTGVEIGLDPSEGSPIQTIADENTAPTNVTFSTAEGEENALTIGDLAPGAMKGIWVKRIVSTNASAYASDNVVIRISGNSQA